MSISSCAGSEVELDGSRSSGGGMKPLTFEWAAHPILSDNYDAIQPLLATLGSVDVARLSTALNGGSNFVFLLRVRTFLGSTSEEVQVVVTRDALPIVRLRESNTSGCHTARGVLHLITSDHI